MINQLLHHDESTNMAWRVGFYGVKSWAAEAAGLGDTGLNLALSSSFIGKCIAVSRIIRKFAGKSPIIINKV